jgi:dynein heavy chain
VLLTALGPPGGGRTHITPRMTRHFNLIAYTEMDNTTVSHIFNLMVDFFLRNFSNEVK